MSDLNRLRIGYVPCSPTLERPGDRRRFCSYARKRGIQFEIAKPSEEYDVVVLTEVADISAWSQFPQGRAKIVFDFIDSYLAVPKLNPKGLLRGIAKFAVRQNRRLLLNYSAGLQEMCRRADAVICTTEEQRLRILPFCANVHVILDFHGTVVRDYKNDYSAEETSHFVWEGLPGSLQHLLEIKEELQHLRKRRPFVIHAITDLEYGRYLNGRIATRNTLEDARKIFPHLYLYAWNERTLSAIVRACDLALIPLPLHDPLCAGKPENKLLLFWRMGMPALVSATAAHSRAMQQSGLSMACATREEWRHALEFYTSEEQARKDAGLRGKAFAEERHSEEKTLAQWDRVFTSLLKPMIVEDSSGASVPSFQPG